MEPTRVGELTPGTPIWVWMVRLGTGRWWPGVVQSLNVIAGFPHVTVRFQCKDAFAGISTTRMRFLERRDLNAKGGDQPHYPPLPLFRVPETRIQKPIPSEAKSFTLNGEVQLAK